MLKNIWEIIKKFVFKGFFDFFCIGRYSCCKLCLIFEILIICLEGKDCLNFKNEEILSFLFCVIFLWFGN